MPTRARAHAGENGIVFHSSEELASQMHSLFAAFPRTTTMLDALRKGVLKSSSLRWQENWDQKAAPVVMQLGNR